MSYFFRIIRTERQHARAGFLFSGFCCKRKERKRKQPIKLRFPFNFYCGTHEIQRKSRELLGFRYIGHSDLYYSICGMSRVWYTPGAVGVGYDTQPIRNSIVL